MAICDYTYKSGDGTWYKCSNPVWAGVPMADGSGHVFSGPLAVKLCFHHAWPSLLRRHEAAK